MEYFCSRLNQLHQESQFEKASIFIGHYLDSKETKFNSYAFELVIYTYLNLNKTDIEQGVAKFYILAGMYKVRPTINVFNMLINGMIKVENMKSAIYFYQMISNYGLKPNLAIFSSIIIAYCNRHNLRKINYYLDRMSYHKIAKTPIIYQYILIECIQQNRQQRFKGIALQMRTASFDPPIYLYKTLINGYLHFNMVNELEEMFRRFILPDTILDIDIYTSIITYYYKTRNLIALDATYTHMCEHKVTPNIVILNHMMNLYVLLGFHSEIQNIRQQLARIETNN